MKHKFNKIYIEITNICGLECSFCPTKILQNKIISLDNFNNILQQIKPFTKDIALHVFGDPLTLSNLKEYLDLALLYNINVHITTTGYYLNNFDLNLFLHKSIKQINFSLNSFNKNDLKLTLEEYMIPMIELSKLKLDSNRGHFINFRLWNIDSSNSEDRFNKDVFNILEKNFNIKLENIDYKDPIRLENKIKLHFDNYFKWPSLDDDVETNGYCYGLNSQIAILSDGTVTACCLDSYGSINLGNIFNDNLDHILNSKRSIDIIEGFKNGIAVETLCKKCTFKHRFDK